MWSSDLALDHIMHAAADTHREMAASGEPSADNVPAGQGRLVSGAQIAGSVMEEMSPGPELARWLAIAHPGDLSGFSLAGAAAAARRLASWAQSCELAAVAEMTARSAVRDDSVPVRPNGGPAAVPEDAADEVALTLCMSRFGASWWAATAITLVWRLPGTFDALRGGQIDLSRARLIAEATDALEDDAARAVQDQVLPAAGQQTLGQLRAALRRAVISVDPQGAERRRQEAERKARVGLYADEEGTATLSGQRLPGAQSAAAMARISALAQAMKASGIEGGIDLLRARAFLGLLLGTLPLIPPSGDPHDPGPEDPWPGDPSPGGPGPNGPGSGNPSSGHPGGGHPGPRDPGPRDPGGGHPGPRNPGPRDPGGGHPGPRNPGPRDPGSGNPSSGHPGGGHPGPRNPGPRDPGGGNPSSGHPSSGHPGGGHPGPRNPGPDDRSPDTWYPNGRGQRELRPGDSGPGQQHPGDPHAGSPGTINPGRGRHRGGDAPDPRHGPESPSGPEPPREPESPGGPEPELAPEPWGAFGDPADEDVPDIDEPGDMAEGPRDRYDVPDAHGTPPSWPDLPLPGGLPAPGCGPGWPLSTGSPGNRGSPGKERRPGLMTVTVPWRTLAGLSSEAGNLCRLGPVTPLIARMLASTAAADPACEWKVIVTGTAGEAVAVTRLRHGRGRADAPGGLISRVTLTVPAGILGGITLPTEPGLSYIATPSLPRRAGSPSPARSPGCPSSPGPAGPPGTSSSPGPASSPGCPSSPGPVNPPGSGSAEPGGPPGSLGFGPLGEILVRAWKAAHEAAIREGVTRNGIAGSNTAAATTAAGDNRAAGNSAARAPESGWRTVSACAHQQASPRYHPPGRLRDFIIARDQTCRFPGCRQPAWRGDLDHTVPYDDGGPTCRCNLGALCRTHHRLKQHLCWHLEQPAPGVLTWTTPAGRKYTVIPDPYAA
jgi:Domain of unknown function (DUF222)